MQSKISDEDRLRRLAKLLQETSEYQKDEPRNLEVRFRDVTVSVGEPHSCLLFEGPTLSAALQVAEENLLTCVRLRVSDARDTLAGHEATARLIEAALT